MTPDPLPPKGFAPHFRKSPVTDPWEPLFSCVEPEAVRLGLRLREAHCNSRGFAHGGVIAALADNAMGLSYGRALGARAAADDGEAPAPARAVTVSLSLDYVASGQLGEWLEVRPRVIRAGRRLGFVDALVMAGDRVVARASATFSAV
ncbi:Acyl-coenzyme A thioesterase PaaI, contains HGG motif [Albimonas donghaensis]|uniref:Acyl-coenzyme A thioesterase PaaI, contains HGG motif n=1 Tax=Albimonas donghaensis TaxID=356660 RepID=A0A1H3AKP7_9RHOB|nr:PaaI family thioesterase [Albimonas donghaensis]SDX29744.1 Acyl-coenzyme A thioesterase PaaI, contains HGG motif [Albimonas donghaensis]